MMDHRQYVGGRWEEIGRLQFQFLLAQGLAPRQVLLDIGCGSLRGGVHFIQYLERGNYLGIEKNGTVLAAGVRQELGEELLGEKEPELLVCGSFEFDRFSRRPDVALAQSVFTHLTPEQIELCLRRLRPFAGPGFRLFGTYFQTSHPRPNPAEPHDHRSFFYTWRQMCDFGRETGWAARYIGSWGHPRGQVMVEYRASD
jgi:SAM-dependent methyltransferase